MKKLPHQRRTFLDHTGPNQLNFHT